MACLVIHQDRKRARHALSDIVQLVSKFVSFATLFPGDPASYHASKIDEGPNQKGTQKDCRIAVRALQRKKPGVRRLTVHIQI
jgi:hypothetical protein